MRIGVSELILVFIVALLVLGPDKLPQYARKFGAALAEFRKASDAATREIRENVVEPLEEAQKPLRDAMEPLEELDRAVKGNLKEVQTSLEHIGKDAPRKASTAQAVKTPDASETAQAVEAAPETADASEAETASEAAQAVASPDNQTAEEASTT